MAFLTSYFASFADDRIFPIQRRATAIGFCNLVARALTGMAPMINEISEPIPMGFFIIILGVALVNTFMLNLKEK